MTAMADTTRLDSTWTDQAILAELGARLSRYRLERNLTQAALAQEAGVSRSTVEKIESGAVVALDSFIRILRVLGLVSRLDSVIAEPPPSPMDRLRRSGARRQRASGSRRARASQPASTWHWGPEAPAG